MSNKQTAVEWLWRWVMDNPLGSFQDGLDAYGQAKEMEKQQIIDAWYDGEAHWDSGKNGNEYYTETYGGQNNEQ
jgi:hypothetical protein